MWTDKQYQDMKSKLKRKTIDISEIPPGETSIINVLAPKGKFLDVKHITAKVNTEGEGNLALSVTSSSSLLYQEMFRVEGKTIHLNLHGFGDSNESRITRPSKFFPDEVVELQKYINQVAYAGYDNETETNDRLTVRIYNESSGITTEDSRVDIVYIEKG